MTKESIDWMRVHEDREARKPLVSLELRRAIAIQYENRQDWREVSLATLEDSLFDEHQEHLQAIECDYPAFEHASEIGDQIIIITQLERRGTLSPEVLEIKQFVKSFCEEMGIDPEQAVKMKLWRNSLKYPDYPMNNGLSFKEAKKQSKSMWELIGGDSKFSHAYLELFGEFE